MTERPLQPPDPEAGKNTVRGGCGALFGALVPASLVIAVGGETLWPFVIATVFSMALFAWLAIRFGESLWEWLARWW